MPFPLNLILTNEAATEGLAATLAGFLRAGDVVALVGDLGAGKTVLARALIRALTGDPDEEVPSPTFTLVQSYDTAATTIWHFDLYRLSDPEEVVELGWDEACSGGIVLVEWPERLGRHRPAGCLNVTLTYVPEISAEARRVVVAEAGPTGGKWEQRLVSLTLSNLDRLSASLPSSAERAAGDLEDYL